ncbi:uncharacterized protein BO97DRAFT_285307 [Aspergillus homomorphus CBS 101889]|uniref:Uncharacterized protein n=1 Tax=Aspergillus homomorphus (strain CBS 101889) TaxID=1450537 RepID=A0A395HIF5_ASPHC|nr:hypothetical protein BO97DRAFT_285307 [Aspergillus homomorphus CBS 101889]RAL06758.1 hypothetical protein BO97DRAFT_285307 [Aspergillus homomorphus CBS 101889]
MNIQSNLTTSRCLARNLFQDTDFLICTTSPLTIFAIYSIFLSYGRFPIRGMCFIFLACRPMFPDPQSQFII